MAQNQSDGSKLTAAPPKEETLARLVEEQVRQEGIQEHISVQSDEFLAIPERLWDRYESLEKIGRGTFGQVYKARNRRVERIVALKALHQQFHDDDYTTSRFWTEGRIMGMLGGRQHHIVNILNMGRSADDYFFIEMEFLEGRPLHLLLQDEHHLEPQLVLRLLQQLAEALCHAHAHNVIHRDVKPQNIIVDAQDHLTLTDFGIAKRADASKSSRSGAGTPAYMAPEQYSQTKFGEITPHTDIYALGILGYQLLTGSLPFKGTNAELMYAHLEEDLPPFSRVLHIPDEIAVLIRTCCQKRPEDRYQDMQAVQQAISDILQKEKHDKYEKYCLSRPHWPNVTPQVRDELREYRDLLGLNHQTATAIEEALRAKRSASKSGSGQMTDESPTPEEATIESPWIDLVTDMTFIWIPGGTFQMGSSGYASDEEPPHKIYIRGFWMAATPVTNQQYRLFDTGHDSGRHGGKRLDRDDQPVAKVSWTEAARFARWLTQEHNGVFEFRLPTEAEWEYACRAGSTSAYFWGNTLQQASRYANIGDRSRGMTPVMQFQRNTFDLYDMLGNTLEWCQDVYDRQAYRRHEPENPLITTGGTERVLRGGAWDYSPQDCRCAARFAKPEETQEYNIGFRLVRSA